MTAGSAADGAHAVLVRLLGPDGATSQDGRLAVVTAGPGWSTAAPRPTTTGVVVWGGDVLDGRGVPALLRHAGRREVALARTRGARGPAGARQVVRTAPPLTRPGPAARARRWLAGGAVVRLAGPGAAAATALDTLAAAAGLDPAPGRPAGPAAGRSRLSGLRVGSGGAVLLLGSAAGRPVVLRVAAQDGPGDPRPTADPLRRLHAAGVRRIPEVLATGTHDGLAWTVETRLPGTTAGRLTPALLTQVADFCATLPPTGGPPAVPPLTSTGHTHLPGLVDGLARVEDVLAAGLPALPGVTGHGDLWAGNLLVEGAALTGVVDWDACHDGAVPGTDVLHAVATDDRMRHHRSLGAELLARPWQDGPTADLLVAAWARAGLDLSPARQDLVGLAWWARQVTAALTRTPALAADRQWVRQNVEAVLDAWRAVLAAP